MPAAIQIWQRALTAFNKFLFCCRTAATPGSFMRLLVNTKKAKRADKNPALFQNQQCIAYTLQLQKHVRLFFLRTYTGDIQIFYDVFWRSIYQLPASQFANAKTIVDLGAHIGMTAAFFQIHCPQAKIYCVEADESNYTLLTNNLQPAINCRSVIAMHAAISNRNNTVYLQKAAHSFNSQIVDSMTGFPVKGIRLEQFLREQQITHIDIIKIDIEGAEAVLLSDDTSWLAITDTILIEVHSEENQQLFTAAAAQHGFRIEKMELENESLYLASKIRHK